MSVAGATVELGYLQNHGGGHQFAGCRHLSVPVAGALVPLVGELRPGVAGLPPARLGAAEDYPFHLQVGTEAGDGHLPVRPQGPREPNRIGLRLPLGLGVGTRLCL